MRALAFTFSAAADGKPLSIDRDCQLLGAYSSGGSSTLGVVSTAPERTCAQLSAPAATGVIYTDILAIARSLNNPFPFQFGDQAFVGTQLRLGESVFLSLSTAGTILLVFDS